MRRIKQFVQVLLLVAPLLAVSGARGQAALLMEEPYGHFGGMNPTGHAAIYLRRVCAETPTVLRRCGAGETGVVVSRYHRIGGYDWLAIPLLPYLYAVNSPEQVPDTADAMLVAELRDQYRRENLESIVPDAADGRTPRGEWTQLVGESYDRKIYGFQIETSQEQDDALIEEFNSQRNEGHFNLLFHNCADFARKVMEFYYAKSIGRNFVADAGIMTPKQAAKCLVKYSKGHSDLEFLTFVVPQVPGSIHRSNSIRGVVESLVKKKRYVVPLVVFQPWVAGGLAVAYLTDGRFHPSKDAEVFDPETELSALNDRYENPQPPAVTPPPLTPVKVVASGVE